MESSDLKEIKIKDYLNYNENKEIKALIPGEKIYFSDKLIKINRYGMNQERNILITNKSIYNIKKKRKINYFYLCFNIDIK